MGRRSVVALFFAVGVGAAAPPGAAAASVPAASTLAVHLASVSSAELAGNGVSFTPSMSENGRYLAFVSDSTNLAVPHGDRQNLYLRDRQAGTTTTVDVNAAGRAGDGYARFPAVSADGSTLAFNSTSTNLVPGDTNGVSDIFVRPVTGGPIERVNVSGAGRQATNFSGSLSISADGRYIAFVSAANNLTADDNNPGADVFVRDRVAATTRRVSALGSSSQVDAYWTAISGDGRRVAFASYVNGTPRPEAVFGVYLVDLTSNQVTAVSNADPGPYARVVLSRDGHKLAYISAADGVVAGDADGKIDVFLYRSGTGVTTKVSRRTPNGITGSIAITPDGHYIVFSSADIATNPTDGKIVRFDTTTGARLRLAMPNGSLIHGGQPATALGGSVVAFQSGDRGLDPAYPDALGLFTADLG